MAKFVGGLTINEFEENFGTVKSVQRGTATLSKETASTTITINEVDTSKAIVLVSNYLWSNISYASSQFASQNVYATLSSSGVTLTCFMVNANYNYNYVSWQVIEFY